MARAGNVIRERAGPVRAVHHRWDGKSDAAAQSEGRLGRWVGDYSLVRDAIEATYPDQFKDFNKRLFTPGGFPRPLGARERKWKTPNGKANFTVPESLRTALKMAPTSIS